MDTTTKQRNATSAHLLAGLFFFVLLIAMLELFLSPLDLEKYDKLFMPTSAYPLFIPGSGQQQDKLATSPHFQGFINEQTFALHKPPGLTRIFVVGGSAAYGWPYRETYGFSGYLCRALEKANPGKFEVVNAAGMSYGSHRVLDVLREVVRHQPDLVIVYSGNNEYVETNTLPAPPKASGWLYRVSALTSRLSLYKALRLALYKAAPGHFQKSRGKDITDIRSQPGVRRGEMGRTPALDQEILAHFRSNLSAMKSLLAEQGIPTIFCTVPVNVLGWTPSIAPPEFKNPDDVDRVNDLMAQIEETFRGGDIRREAHLLEQALAILPEDAGLLFNYGKALWELKEYDKAYGYLVRAKDVDARPMRALTPFNTAIRDLADENHKVFVADLDQAVTDFIKEGHAEGVFLDYCHPTEQGHQAIARILLPVMGQALGDRIPSVGELARSIALDDQVPPKDNYMLGHELYAQAITFQNNRNLELASQAYRRILELLPGFTSALSNLADIYFDAGQSSQAKALYQQALKNDPGNQRALLNLGFILLDEKKPTDAVANFQRVAAENPTNPGAHEGLGLAALQTGQYQQAITSLEHAITLGDDSPLLRRSLARAHQAIGDTGKAVENWRAVLKFEPSDSEALKFLGQHRQ